MFTPFTVMLSNYTKEAEAGKSSGRLFSMMGNVFLNEFVFHNNTKSDYATYPQKSFSFTKILTVIQSHLSSNNA